MKRPDSDSCQEPTGIRGESTGGFGDPVATAYEGAVGSKNEREPKMSGLDPTRVLRSTVLGRQLHTSLAASTGLELVK